MDDVFVVQTADITKSDYVVSAKLTFWFLLNVLVILYPTYFYEDCNFSNMVRTANYAWVGMFRMLIY